MSKLVTGTLFASAAAVAALVLSAPAALAAGTWTVSGGPNFTGSPQSTAVWFFDLTTGQAFFCTSSSISGTARDGTGLDGNAIAALNSGTFALCSDINGDTTGNASLSSGSLNGVSFDSGTGTTSGTITGINASLMFRDTLGTCNVTVAGAVNDVTYKNNGTLTVTSNTPDGLTVTSATGSGCGGLWNTNDNATFAGTYTLTPTITITSP